MRWLSIVPLATMLFFGASAVEAQRPGFVTALSSGPVRVAYQKGVKEEKDPSKDPSKHRPVLEFSKYGRTKKVDVQMAEKRRSIREQIENLLKYENDPKEKPALLFRLAENYFEEAEAFFNQAQELDELLARDPTNEALRRRIDEQKKSLRTTEDKWRAMAIDQYKNVANNYQNFPGRDQVLFYLGYSLWDMKRFKEALAVFKEMIASYQNSKYVPDAYLRFGEYYFEEAMLDKALMAYKKVADFTASSVYHYAIYKQGWCYYNLHEWEKAKDMFKSVVSLSDMGEGSIELRKEALNDFTLTYSHYGSAEAAPRVFKNLSSKDSYNLLRNLAGMYFADGNDMKAVILYRYLISAEKCSAEVPFFQGRIVESVSKLGNKRDTIAQVREMIEKFKTIQKCLQKPDDKQKARIAEARELAEVTLRKLASVWYKEAKETKDKTTFEYAQEMFSDYLDLFPNAKDAYDMRFAFAELLFHRLGRFDRAAVEYSKIVAQDLAYLKANQKFPEAPKEKKEGQISVPGTYFCDSAYKAMQAHRELIKKERRSSERSASEGAEAGDSGEGEDDGASASGKDGASASGKDGASASGKDGKAKEAEQAKGENVCEAKMKVPPKKAIPKFKRRFLLSAEVYLDHCPRDEDILDVKYDIAKTYYDYYHLEESIKRFDEIARDFPTSDLAEYAVNLVLDALNEMKDFDRLNEIARKYSKNAELVKKEKIKARLDELIPKIAFMRIDALECNLRNPPPGKPRVNDRRIHAKIAKGYTSFWREFPKHELADEALFNASVKYEQAEQLDNARKARQFLIQQYPQSELVPGTIFNLAENAERLAEFDAAAELYERYASTYKKMKGLGKADTRRDPKAAMGKKKRKKSVAMKKDMAEKGEKGEKGQEKRFEGNKRTWNLEDAENALYNAGVYREALHQYKEAIADRLEFIDLFPDSKDASKVFYSLGLLYEKLEMFPKAGEVFLTYSQRYIDQHTDRAISALMRYTLMLRKLKKANMMEIDKIERQVMALVEKHSRGKKQLKEAEEAAAHAAFFQAESAYNEYISYRFMASTAKSDRLQQEHIKKQLNEKTNLFKKVDDIYKKVALRKQAEWTIASLYKLGRAYENFAETYYQAPLPKGLTQDQVQVYQDALRSQGQPFEDKAVAHFKAAVEKGSELGFYSEFTQQALAKLQHYRPDEYPREQLMFELGVVAESVLRTPLLVATWDETKKHPELLNEPPLVSKREASVVSESGGSAGAVEPPPEAPPPENKPVAKEKAAPVAGEKKDEPAQPEKPNGPASDAFTEDEPGDSFGEGEP